MHLEIVELLIVVLRTLVSDIAALPAKEGKTL